MPDRQLTLERDEMSLELSRQELRQVAVEQKLMGSANQQISNLNVERDGLLKQLEEARAHDLEVKGALSEIWAASKRLLEGMHEIEKMGLVFFNSDKMKAPEFTAVALPMFSGWLFPQKQNNAPDMGLHTSKSVNCVGAIWGAIDYAFGGRLLGKSLSDDAFRKEFYNQVMLVNAGNDPFYKGAVGMIATQGVGREITKPKELREGEILQVWWWNEKQNCWKGHASMVEKIARDVNGNIEKLHYISATPLQVSSPENAIRTQFYSGHKLHDFLDSMGHNRELDGDDHSPQLYAARMYDVPGTDTYARERDLLRDANMTADAIATFTQKIQQIERTANLVDRVTRRELLADLPANIALRASSLLTDRRGALLTQKELDESISHLAASPKLNINLATIAPSDRQKLQEELLKASKQISVSALEARVSQILGLTEQNLSMLKDMLAKEKDHLSDLALNRDMGNQQQYLDQRQRVEDFEMKALLAQPLVRALAEDEVRRVILAIENNAPKGGLRGQLHWDTIDRLLDSMWL